MKPFALTARSGVAALVLAAAVGFGPAAGLAQDERGDATMTDVVADGWEEIEGFTAAQSEAAERRAELLLEEMDAALARLKARADASAAEAGESARENWDGAIERLQTLREAAADQTEALGDASADAWAETKQSFRHAASAFANAFDAADEEVRRDDGR